MQTERWKDQEIENETRWFHQERAKRCVAALQRRRLDAHYTANRDEARRKVLELIPDGATIGLGDSLTLVQIGLLQDIEDSGKYKYFDPFYLRQELPLEKNWHDQVATMRKALTADVFITGINAVTQDGRLVSTDDVGNRVGGLIFGSSKAIVVAGANKIVKNLDEAMERIKQVAAPKVIKWHNLKHDWKEDLPPCGITGMCPSGDCSSPFRVCNFTVIIEGESFLYRQVEGQKRLSVIIVGEELGL